jgi:hypothetical protein
MEEKSRPIGVTVLAILAGILAVLAAIAALQWLGFFPRLGPGPAIRTFNLWYALMFGLLAWIYIWLTQMLWNMDQSAWIFLAVITVFNLILALVAMIGSSWEDVALSVILNSLILIYIMLPGTRRAFGRE